MFAPLKTPKLFFQGQILAKTIGAAKYVECSALTNVGVENVFNEAIDAWLYRKTDDSKKRKMCCC